MFAAATPRRIARTSLGRLMLGAAVALLIGSAHTAGQIADQFIVYSDDPITGAPYIHRYARDLKLIGTTDMTGYTETFSISSNSTVVENGDFWIGLDALNYQRLVRVSSAGQVAASVQLGHNPLTSLSSREGDVYALTRIPLLVKGPLYSVSDGNAIEWSNLAGPSTYWTPPQQLSMTSSGNLWITSTSANIPPYGTNVPWFTKIDRTDGEVLAAMVGPTPGWPGPSYMSFAVAGTEGEFWVSFGDHGEGAFVVAIRDAGIVQQFPVLGVGDASMHQVRADGVGRLWLRNSEDPPKQYADLLYGYDTVTGQLVATHFMGGYVEGFALGPTGEDLLALTAQLVPPFPRRLVRLNLVTGVQSSIAMEAPGPSKDLRINNGDSTGFIFANVIDQQGDNDGDGVSNRAETAAGSNPFDALSRPEGPKIYIDFAPSNNALILTFKDKDGLLDPVGGLDAGSISLTLGPYGNVFSALLPFLTWIEVSPDLTEATVLFGALPLPSDKQWEVEASVADLSGATGWDWQVTPPGEL